MADESGVRGVVRRVIAPAKLTVTLRVQGVRPDGYHLLAAEMVSLDLADELRIDPGGSGLRISAEAGTRADDLSAGPDNLVRQALTLAGRSAGVELTKRIPVRGGLGGGSADAGAVLRWAGLDDPAAAASLGADVPFCVRGGRALVGGIGEQVEPLPFEPRSFVLLVPPLGVDTGAVYRAWDRLSSQLGRPWHEPPNDLTRAAIAVEPRLADWRRIFAGATGRDPVLAGSGSTWFVEGDAADLRMDGRRALAYRDQEARVVVAHAVPEHWGGPDEALETSTDRRD
ncbi:MAG TPA: 4-(cytidine 5'-diphospho)-2-C-methyl-D-erythritol kinase [Acidimicrobiales bacterium]|nr:4-(cytidine 5'-diphospho)-2-C-methyl-D-erythritol kinase [Acidimicrobiales bacterium]